MHLYLLAIGLYLLGAAEASAQSSQESGSLTGRVVSFRNGSPINGGFVRARRLAADSVAPRSLAVPIDSAGHFQFPALRPGSYALRVQGTGMLGGHDVVYVPAGSVIVHEIVATPPRFDPRERDGQIEALADNAEKWTETAPRSYTFDVRMGCFCPGALARWSVAVKDESTRVLNTAPGADLPLHLSSIPGILEWISRVLHDPTRVVEIRYNARLGYPEYIRTDIDPYVTDSWFEIRVDRLRPAR